MKKLLVSIYKSSRKDEMYLYVLKQESLNKVPEALLQTLGKAEHVLDMLLTPERTLARAETVTVISAIETDGYYLQMPPSGQELLDAVTNHRAVMP